MDNLNLIEALGQVSTGEAGKVFRGFFRGAAYMIFAEVMAAEVDQLCGPKHQPNEGEMFRAGSSSGKVLLHEEHETITRPRVRKTETNGTTGDVREMGVSRTFDEDWILPLLAV